MKLQLDRNYNLPDDFPFDIPGMNARMDQIVAFRDKAPRVCDDWIASINSILDFQLEDGSFALAENWDQMPFEERYYYVYRPSYACCQALMKSLVCVLSNDVALPCEDELDPRVRHDLKNRTAQALSSGLAFCCTRNFAGDGYDGIEQTIRDILDFRNACLPSGDSEYRALCPEFFKLIERIVADIQARVDRVDVFNAFGGSHLVQMMELLESFDMESRVNVFVYGTLMTGMRNAHLVEHSAYLGDAQLFGYTMFDLGSYPGIIPAEDAGSENGCVLGEVRRVDVETLKALNELEGEGRLYKATCVEIKQGTLSYPVLAYVYLGRIEQTWSEIPPVLQPYNRFAAMRDNLVWYVAYGSNIKYERFMTYIQGGTCRFNGRTYRGCTDHSAPLASTNFPLPHDVYFGNESPSWFDGGVAFLDTSKPGHAFGRAYLITREQFEQLHAAEGSGPAWYPDVVKVGEISGIPALTFTNNVRREPNEPDSDYVEVFMDGLLDSQPIMDEELAWGYVSSRYTE